MNSLMMAQLTDKQIIDGFTQVRHFRYFCPVCNLDWQWTEPLENISVSFDICPQCGIEFGYEDTSRSHSELRSEWERAGRPWLSGVISREQYERVMIVVSE